MTMRKLFLLIVAAITLAGCTTSYDAVIGTDGRPLSKEESAKVIRNTVRSKVENRDFRILVDEMNPISGPTLHLRDNDWALEVHRDSIGSVLPYFGRGYNVPYGSAMGMHFITRMDSYSVEHPKDNMWIVKISCHTVQEGYDFQIQVFDNGRAYISVNTRYRDMISYNGYVDLRGIALKRVQ